MACIFAYRVRDEALRYCANSFDRDGTGLLVPESPVDRRANLRIALDLQLLQKVLPRFSGGREQIEAPLREPAGLGGDGGLHPFCPQNHPPARPTAA